MLPFQIEIALFFRRDKNLKAVKCLLLTFSEVEVNVSTVSFIVAKLDLSLLLLLVPAIEPSALPVVVDVPGFLRGDVDRHFLGDVSDTLPTLYNLPSCTKNSLATAVRSAFLTITRKSIVSSVNTILLDFCT